MKIKVDMLGTLKIFIATSGKVKSLKIFMTTSERLEVLGTLKIFITTSEKVNASKMFVTTSEKTSTLKMFITA